MNITSEELNKLIKTINKETFIKKMGEVLAAYIVSNSPSTNKITVNECIRDSYGGITAEMSLHLPKLNVVSGEICRLIDMGVTTKINRNNNTWTYNLVMEVPLFTWTDSDQDKLLMVINNAFTNYITTESLIDNLWKNGIYCHRNSIPSNDEEYLLLSWVLFTKQQSSMGSYQYNTVLVRLVY